MDGSGALNRQHVEQIRTRYAVRAGQALELQASIRLLVRRVEEMDRDMLVESSYHLDDAINCLEKAQDSMHHEEMRCRNIGDFS